MFPKTPQKTPEMPIVLLAYHMQTDQVAGQRKVLELLRGLWFYPPQRTHGTTQLRTFEVPIRVFFRNSQCERPEPLAVLDEVVQVFANIRCPRRSQNAAVSQ